MGAMRIGWLRRLCMLLLAMVGGVTLACAVAVFGVVGGDGQSIALACGIGNPQTMIANDTPAFFYPVAQGKNPPSLGQFPIDYAVKTPIAFSEDLSRAPGAPSPDAFKWRWHFGDGSATVTDEKPNHTYTKTGTFVIKVDAYIDNTWNTDFDSAEIHIVSSLLPDPPVVKINVSTHVAKLLTDVQFSDAGSHSSDGSALTYFWNFNDSFTATTQDATHQFATIGSTGKNIVALVVKDARGARSVAWTEVDVYAELPTAAVTANVTDTQVGHSVTFDASDSQPPELPSGTQLVRYEWNFGDGTPAVNTQTPTATHTFQKAGTFNVTVNVVDSRGAYVPATISVKVAAGPSYPWLIWVGAGGLVLAVLIGGLQLWREQRRAEALERQRREERALARARRINRGSSQGRHPRDDRRGGPYR